MNIALHTAYFFRGDIIPCIVEVEATKGIGIHLVGLADSSVKETLLRVVTAIQALGFSIPGKKVVINVTPHGGHNEWAGAIRPKDGVEAFDLAIALGILIATEQIPRPSWYRNGVDQVLFFAKVGLDGRLMAPFTGIDGDSAAAVLSWQLRRDWAEIIGYPADDNVMSIYSSEESLGDIIRAIQDGNL